ncbi:hypothetical protein HanXRQr2_Chr10g0442731 [Helianthus annuus]|uniref:Uncharacterized protein n=1 Tax=Helianthus annuus TaxID=4232 RepID=A0A9K3N4L4_HELAN|nr:hypothetical protein HanXRQr2_Chr10g0442731 [Helianthus annuus]
MQSESTNINTDKQAKSNSYKLNENSNINTDKQAKSNSYKLNENPNSLQHVGSNQIHSA